MPFTSTAVRNKRRAQVRRRDGDAPCALQITEDCRAVGGAIDYDAKPPHPRSFEVDHIVSSEQAEQMGWGLEAADALDNCQAVCRQCNREKSDGMRSRAEARPTYLNPRFT